MPLLALAFGLAQIQNPTTLHSRVISAAIFKPGIAMLVREVAVPAGRALFALDDLPDAIDGTFWFDSPDDVLVSDVATTIRLQEDSKAYDAKTIAEMIYANVGKHMVLKVTKYNNEPESVSGTLTNLEERTGEMTLKLEDGHFRTVQANQVVDIDPTGLNTNYTRKGKVPMLRVQFKVNAPKAGHVRFTTIEPGAAWNASYLVDLGVDNMSRVEGKAQLGLGGLKFEETDVKLMAGMPTLPSGPKFDLASGYGSLDAYLHGSQTNFAGQRPGTADPYDLFATWVQQVQLALARYTAGMYNGYPSGYAGGGFGGFNVAGDSSVGLDFGGRTGSVRSGQLLPNDTSIFRSESLYAYPIGPTTLEPGDRLTKLLFEQQSHYRTVYHWEGIDANNSVEEFLRIHNDAKNPWTGGVVTVAKAGIPLAQTDMPFTAAGHDADLTLGKAPDILTDKDVQEIKAEPVSNIPSKGIARVRLTEQTRMALTNTKDEAVTIEVVLTLPGEVVTSGAKVEKLPRRFGDLNQQVHLTWTLQLGPGEQKRIEVTNTFVK